nr:MAG TPA: hypothetical protein [Caudoviricetes sp.]
MDTNNLKQISKFVRYMMENADVKPKVAAECIGYYGYK